MIGTGFPSPPRVAEETQEHPEGSLQLPAAPQGQVRGQKGAQVLV